MILIKILLCIIILCLLILILPISYLLDIKISEQKSILFCLSYFFGVIKIKYDDKFKIKVFGLDIKIKDGKKDKNKKQKKNIRTKSNKFYKKNSKNEKHEKSSFDYDSLKDFLPSALEFIFDIIKIIRPKSIKIKGELGLENPADTGYLCAILAFVINIFDLEHELKFDFNNKIFNLNLIFNGKSYALVFILILLKYLRRNEVTKFIRSIKNI